MIRYALFLTMFGGWAQAAPITSDKIPDALRNWIPWAMHGHEAALCPVLPGQKAEDEDATGCAWPGQLELVLDGQSGKFSQKWRLYRDSWVALPGDANHLALDLRADNKPQPVMLRDGKPSVFLKSGEHLVSGRFVWDQLPESLAIPPETGLLQLSVNGRTVNFPSRDAQGLVWLQKEAKAEAAENRLEVIVHRRVVDEIPLQMIARITLNVSGKSREVVLGKALLPGFSALSLSASLPVRIDADGRLRVQVRAGSWNIELAARHDTPLNELTLVPAEGPWAQEEVWVFEARPDFRVLMVDGVPAVDPQQTTLPNEWRALPAYRVRPKETMRFVVERRGDADPAPDKLHLRRILWLDFDGHGYSVRDHLSGRLSRSWRLEMMPSHSLGRVAVDGRDQLITRGGVGSGVEIRQGNLALIADGRFEGGAFSVPAVGWNHDFHSVQGVLHIPPGWRLFHAGGVDEASETWIRSWSLLDLFLVLVLALGVFRLWGWRWGVIALCTLVLAFPEEDAPRWLWVLPLLAEGLVRVVPKTWRLHTVAGYARFAFCIILLLVLVPFSVEHVRHGLFPVLEQSYKSFGEGHQHAYQQVSETWSVENVFGRASFARKDIAGDTTVELPKAAATPAAPAVVTEKLEAAEKLVDLDGARDEDSKKEVESGKLYAAHQIVTRGGYGYKQKIDLAVMDPKAQVQTGPGLPEWDWQRVQLHFSGPVERTQMLHLWLLPPWLNMFLALVRVLLLAVLFLRVMGQWGLVLRALRVGVPAALLLIVVMPRTARAELPSDDLIEQLRTRLSEKPSCFPDCASTERLLLQASGSQLRLRLEVGAQAPTAVPLPGGVDSWVPERVLYDGKPTSGLRRSADGVLWLQVGPGMHQVVLEGALANREAVQISLTQKPHHVEAKTSGWTVDGLHENGSVDDTLQLQRTRSGKGDEKFESNTLPPYVQVERDLLLGLQWQVETRVRRLTPSGTPIVLEIPLLEGESVTSEVRAEGGKAIVNMGPSTNEVKWRSVLKERPKLVLTAPQSGAYGEVWHLEVGQVWHFSAQGIPPVHRDPSTMATRVPEWRPWPGESVALLISRPDAAPGSTLTIQSSDLLIAPGLRATDATLTLRLSSSRGTQHSITMPEGAQLQSISIGGRAQPIRQDGRKVTFPVTPGDLEVVIEWRQGNGIQTLLFTPQVDLGAPSGNHVLRVQLEHGRWVLFAGGPRVGPAVLFWSLLLVMLLVALGLGRVQLTPLSTTAWMLLAIGLTQVSVVAAASVAGWLLAIGWRKQHASRIENKWLFNLVQICLTVWALIAAIVLFDSIRQGLLGEPNMQVSGNGSRAQLLRWFIDRNSTVPQGAWVLSVPMMFYRLAMLAWALWLAVSLIAWMRWAWGAFSELSVWRRLRKPSKPAVQKPTS